MEEKNDFWEDFAGLVENVPKEERIVLGADLNGHVGEGNIGDEEIMGRYNARTKNKKGSMVVDFGKRMDLVIVYTYFKKKNEHRVTYKSGGKSTQVDYVMCKRKNLKEMCDCKVIMCRKAALYGGMQNGSYGEKKKAETVKTKIQWWKLKETSCQKAFRQGTSLNIMHLAILNANFHSYQLNNCNCQSDTMALQCWKLKLKENRIYLFSCQIGSLTNWLADKSACRQVCPIELSPAKLVPPKCLASCIGVIKNKCAIFTFTIHIVSTCFFKFFKKSF